MERKPQYSIPAGTRVEVRNTAGDGQLRQHITKRELTFTDRAGTGYNGAIVYFEHEGWQICVHAVQVKTLP